MLKNYFHIAIRNLLRNKVYSLINITGLSIGLAGCLLVANMVIDDLSYDKDWKNADRIYRINSISKGTGERLPVVLSGLGPTLKRNFPEIKGACRLEFAEKKRFRVDNGKESFTVRTMLTEPSIWTVFDFHITLGTPGKMIAGYPNLVITEKLKNKYFQGINPVGKLVQSFNSVGDSVQCIISGVIKNIPYNTHLRSDALIIKPLQPGEDALPANGAGYVYPYYVLLANGVHIPDFTAKVNRLNKDSTSYMKLINYEFQSLNDIYLHSDFAQGYQPVQGNLTTIFILCGIAVVLLLVACFNFINLTLARALKRMPETGIRKVLGAGKQQLILQFLFESIIFFVISFIVAMVLYNLSLKPLEAYIGHELTINLLRSGLLFACTLGFVFLISLFTGLYPALILSRIRPALILKGKFSNDTGSIFLRKSLVVAQFVIAIVVLIATIVVQNQLYFFNNKDLGFDKNNLLVINVIKYGDDRQAFKKQLLQIAGIENASVTRWIPSGSGGDESGEVDDPKDKTHKINIYYIEGDIDLAATLKLQIAKGRLFDRRYSTDQLDKTPFLEKNEDEQLFLAQKRQSFLMTEYTAKFFKITHLDTAFAEAGIPVMGTPVGIVKNFNNESLHYSMKPCIITASDSIKQGNVLVRVQQGAERQVIAAINRLWPSFYPGKTFDYSWVSDLLAAQYKAESQLQQLFIFFSFLTIFLACLGLLGLVIFNTELRTKEIGIRKVLGATVINIVALISSDYMKLLLVAIFVASPIGWWAMNKWLQGFAYRINIGAGIFMLAGLLICVIVLATVSFQAIKAAVVNPVKSLRSE